MFIMNMCHKKRLNATSNAKRLSTSFPQVPVKRAACSPRQSSPIPASDVAGSPEPRSSLSPYLPTRAGQPHRGKPLVPGSASYFNYLGPSF